MRTPLPTRRAERPSCEPIETMSPDEGVRDARGAVGYTKTRRREGLRRRIRRRPVSGPRRHRRAASCAIFTSVTIAPWRWSTPTWRPSFATLGHTVEYALERVPAGADLYVFNPSLITLPLERARHATGVANDRRAAACSSWGPWPIRCPRRSTALAVTIVKGEAEQLLWKLDDVLARQANDPFDVGKVARSGLAAVARLVAILAAKVQHRLRLYEVPHGAHPAEPRLHAQVQLLPVHHPGKRHAIADTAKAWSPRCPRASSSTASARSSSAIRCSASTASACSSWPS